MQFKAKKLLLIMELNETLLFINNQKSKVKHLGLQNMNIKFNDHFDHYNLLYRQGKGQFLQQIFTVEKKHMDFAVWSNLDQELTQLVAQRYFGRFYRQLLFIIATNRGLYPQALTNECSIKIPKNLQHIYSRFQGYNATNTLVFSSQPNTLQEHRGNDVILPIFNPLKQFNTQDTGCYGFGKYIRGIRNVVEEKVVNDIRQYTVVKPIDKFLERYSNRYFKQTEYR